MRYCASQSGSASGPPIQRSVIASRVVDLQIPERHRAAWRSRTFSGSSVPKGVARRSVLRRRDTPQRSGLPRACEGPVANRWAAGSARNDGAFARWKWAASPPVRSWRAARAVCRMAVRRARRPGTTSSGLQVRRSTGGLNAWKAHPRIQSRHRGIVSLASSVHAPTLAQYKANRR